MKYTEFTQLMENKGFKVEDDGEVIIVKENFYPVAKIYKDTTESYALNFSQFDEQPRKLRRFIAQACHELAFTDLDDREDEKLYYVKHKWLEQKNYNYLSKNINKNTFEVTMKGHGENFKDQFTQKEINENTQLVKEIELEIWEQVEVE